VKKTVIIAGNGEFDGLITRSGKLLWVLLLLITILAVASCRKPERNNIWDEKSIRDPQEWSPQNLQISTLSPVIRKLSWDYGAHHIEGFKIDRKKGEEPWQEAYATLPKTAREWTDDQIVPDPALVYQYRVYAFAGINISDKPAITSSAAIPAPTGLSVIKLTDISYKLEWNDNSTGEQGFVIDRKIHDGEWVIALAKVLENQKVFVDENVFSAKSAVNVQYRVYAYFEAYHSGFAAANTNAALTPPSNLSITQNSITSVTLNWQDNSTGEEGFRIERGYEGGNWAEIAKTTNNSYHDNAFNLNTQVYYRISAYYGQYQSSFVENSINSQIPGPINLQIFTHSTTSITLNWSYSLTGHDGFIIDRKAGSGAWVTAFATVGPGQTSYQDNAIALISMSYSYRVYLFYGNFFSQKIEVSHQMIQKGSLAFGGIVFYLDGSGGGMVCAQSDQSTSTEWGCYGSSIGGTGTALGTGAANTAKIVAGCSQAGIAARICNELVLNGYSDWFLPSKDELNLMYQNLKQAGLGGFADDWYWSSSECSSGNAWEQSFDNGYQNSGSKYYNGRVRAVRAF